MKTALYSTFIGAGLLILLFAGADIFPRKDGIDIHLHDTYFVTTYSFLAGFIFLTLGSFFSIGGVIGTSFKSLPYWLLLLVFFSAETYFIIRYKFWNFFT